MQNTEEILMRVGMDLASINAKTNELLQRQSKAAGSIKSMWNELGAVFSGAAILGGLNSVINKFDDLQDRADNLGVGTDFLQGMGGVANQNAVGGLATFNKAIGELANKLGDAKEGGEKSIETFAKFGITLREIQTLNTEQMFYLISDRIKAIPDPAMRVNAAFELLGKSGKNLTGILAGGATELKKMADAVDKLDAEKVKQLAEAKDRIEATKTTLTVWGGKALGAIGDYYGWWGRIAAQGENLLRNGELLNDANSKDLELAKQKANAQKDLIAAKKEELETAKKIAEESKNASVKKLTTERTEIIKQLKAGEQYASPEAIAGRDAMARIKSLYGEGGAMDLGAGKSRLAGVAAEYERAKMDEVYSRGMGWTERANRSRMQSDKMLGVLEKYGAAPAKERLSDVVNKLVDVDNKLANLGVTIKGIE